MQRLGKNLNRYFGDTIDIGETLRNIASAARENHWLSETFFNAHDSDLIALRRSISGEVRNARRVYISAGIHGDEPAGPLAVLRLLQENRWPDTIELWVCPCLNPHGFRMNCRENASGIDLNRAYRNPSAQEIIAHIAWLDRQPEFDLCLLLHEDWESHGFYLYEQNPDRRFSLAEAMIGEVAKVCPIDQNDMIEGRPAKNGIIRPNVNPHSRPDWPEAFYLIQNKTRLSYTLEAPSDFPLATRVNALITAVNTALAKLA
ncbi:MAG TPA: M14 family metallocarboxypeptidase [Candidatus Paceibacterota bacterium]|nr:M14 family metallocarboxypeptidase [Candidatus Paceibacterota bacterium]